MSSELFFETKFTDFLHSTRHLCKISEVLRYESLLTLNDQGNFIKVENKDTLSFIPKNKLHLATDGFDNTKYRVHIKIGRFITKFMKKEARMIFYIQDSDIEIFVNLFKSYFDTDTSNFKIISGEEILHWYLESNYFQHNDCKYGTLWNSCMRYSHKNRFMKIYSENPDQIKMLINVDKNGKLKTRALLWEDVTDENGKSYKVMDRIYSVYDYEVSSFKKWASENGYIHKLEQSSKSELHFVTPNGTEILNLTAKINNWKHMMYPYIDTFKFLNFNKGVLSNSERFYYDFILVQNDGRIERDEEPQDLDGLTIEDW
jgi:hypothetical protein